MKYLILFLFLVFAKEASAQKTGQILIDSLLKEISKSKEDSNGVNLLLQLSNAYNSYAGPQKAIPFAEKGLKIAENIGWKKGISSSDVSLAHMIGDSGNNTRARFYFQKSYEIDQETGSKIGMIRNLNAIGRTYVREGDFSSAMTYYVKGLTLAEEMKDYIGIADLSSGITAVYFAQNNNTKAKEYGLLSLKNAKLANVFFTIGKASQMLGAIQMELKDTVGAKQYLLYALKTFKDLSNKQGVASVLVDLALSEGADYLTAIKELKESLDISNLINPLSISTLESLEFLGSDYLEMALRSPNPLRKNYLIRSDEYLMEAIDRGRKSRNIAILGQVYQSKKSLEEAKGNFKDALMYFQKYTVINDSIYSQDKKNEIADLEGKYKLEGKDKEISVNNLILVKQRRVQIGLIVILAIFGIVGGLFYRQSRILRKTNTTLITLNTKLDEANKIKAKFFGILSHDLRSPISRLIHFLQIQKTDPKLLDENQRELFQHKISNSAEELLSNMEAMLLWSKDQIEDFKPNKRLIPLSDLFNYIQKFFSLPENLEIKFQGASDLTVFSDENYLNTIMQNLTSNAIKALNVSDKSFHGVIEWDAKRMGDQVVLTITDNGPGIGKEQSLAFEKEHVAVNEKSGFGLYLVKDLAKAIQCLVSVKSGEGLGTTFTLIL